MIEAGRLQIAYTLGPDHASAHLMKARLDDLARERLAVALGAAFARYADEDDGSVWLIRRLETEIDVDVRQNDDQVAKHWGRQLSACIVKKLDPEDPDVLYFENRAAYLARYVAERAAGTAHGKWYFKAFDGLAALPVSAAIRTALIDDPARGLTALCQLPSDDVGRIAAALAEADARNTLGQLAAQHSGEPGLEALITAWDDSRAALARHAPGAALCAFVRISQQQPAGPDAAKALLAIAGFARLARELPEPSLDELAGILRAGDSVALVRNQGFATADQVSPLLGCPAELMQKLLPAEAAAPRPDPERRYTPFGGLFLLLPRIAELPLPGEFGDLALLRLWIAIKCFGTPRACPVFLDPLVRELLGVDENVSADAFVKWQARLPQAPFRALDSMLAEEQWRRGNSDVLQPGDKELLRLPGTLRASRARDRMVSNVAQRVLRNFAWRLPGFSNSSFGHLFDNFLDFPASIEENAGRYHVTLGRAPLSLVLNMTGIARDSYVCPWLGDVMFQLFPEG